MLEIAWLMLLFAALGVGPALLFAWLVRTARQRAAILLLTTLVLISVGGALNLTYGVGVGIFGGALSCLVPPIVAVSVISILATRARTWQLVRQDPRRRRLYVAGAVLVPLLQLAPLAGEFAIVTACDALNRQAGDTVVRALQAYRADQQAYPQDLAALSPEYLERLPPPRCFAPFGWFRGLNAFLPTPGLADPATDGTFHLERCPYERATLLTVPSIRLEFIQRCNLETGDWSRVSFLDGACSYLP